MKKFLTALAFVFIITAIIAPSSAFAVDVATSADLTAALPNGGKIKLTNDIPDWGGDFTLSNDTTLDLAGKTLKSTATENKNAFRIINGAVMTINDSVGKGKIDASAGKYVFRVIGDTTEGDGRRPVKSTLIINGGEFYTQSYGVFIYGEGAQLDVNGGTIKSESGFGISGNGTAKYKGTTINIKAGTIIGGNNAGGASIYHPQEGILNITGGEFFGCDGIQFKGGTLNMSAGTITTTGVKLANLNDNSNGSVQTGAAISFVSNENYAGNMKLILSGTAKLVSSASHAIWEDTSVGNKLQTVSVNISGGNFSGTVAGSADVMYFKNRANISDFAVTGGTYNSDPKEYVKSGYVATKNGDVYIVTSEKKPVEPMLPDNTPVEVADKIIVTSVDMSLKGASKDEAINVAAEKVVTEIITDGGIAQSYLTVNETGKVVAKPELVEKAIKSVTLPKNEVLVTGTITPLPILRAEVSNDKVAAITFEVSAQDLKAKKAGDVKLFKVLSPTKGDFFKFVDTPASVDDTSFALQPSSVDVDNRYFLSADAAIETGKSYRLTMFIKDNGKFDLNKTPGLVADPAELIETKTVTPSSGSSSGCNAGFAALALLAVVPVIYRRKK